MPRQNSTDWASWNPILASRLQDINEDIDDIYLNGSDHFKVYRLTWDPALQVRIGPGSYRVGTSEWSYAWWTITVWASVTTYIMLNSAWSIVTSTVWWDWQNARIAVVISWAWSISSITDWRSKIVWWDFWGNPTWAVVLWSTNSAPTWYLLCDGSAVSRTTYAGLFSVIWTTYGVWNWSTTFNLPNIWGRIPVGKKSAVSKGTATISIASPGVVTLASHWLANWQKVYFTTTGALPTGLSINTDYYIVNADTNTFQLATTIGGTAINTSWTQSGTHTLFSSDFNTLGGTGWEESHKLTKNEMPSHTHDFPVYNGWGWSYATQYSNSWLYISNATTSAVWADKEHLNIQPYIVLNYIIKT